MTEKIVKILILGDSAVGKTSVLVKLCEDKFQHDYISTIGVDFKTKSMKIDDITYKMQLWDTCGQERFRTITTTLYRGVCGIILAFAIDNRQSFSNVEAWIDQIKINGEKDLSLILAGCKCDLEKSRKVTQMEAQQLAKAHNIEYIEVSAKDNINVEEIFMKLLQNIREIKQFDNQLIQKTENLKEIKKQSEKQKSETSSCC